MATKSLYFDIIGRDKSGTAAIKKVGAEMLAFGALTGAAMGVAIKKAADFDAQLSQVKSLSHATSDEMAQLREAALSMGRGIGFSATQVADAETELVKAGISVKDILGGSLTGALNLAAAGQIDVAKATQIAAVSMTQFHLAGKDVPHLADLLAAGADKALGGVDQLGDALNQGGLVASQFGLSIEDTVGTLSAFANAGLLGSDAGTSMKTMLLSLAAPSTKASDLMRDLGISAYDANGKFVGITNLAGQLHDKLGTLADAQRNAALATIFGTDAIRSANVLMEQGSDGIKTWITDVNDQGFAAEQASAKMDNLNGDMQKLGATMETDLIKSGSAANDVLRFLAQTADQALGTFADAPDWVQGTTMAVAGLTAGATLLTGGFITLVPKIEATRASMTRLKSEGISVAKVLGKGGLVAAGIAVATTALSGIGNVGDLAATDIASLNAALKNTFADATLNELFTGMQGTTNATNGLSEAVNKVTSSGFDGFIYQVNKGVWGAMDAVLGWIPAVKDLDNGITKNEAQLKQLGQTLAETAKDDFPTAAKQFAHMVEVMGGGNDAARKLLQTMPDYKASLIDLAGAHGKTLRDQELLNLAMGKGSLAQQIVRDSAAKSAQALAELSGKAQSASLDVDKLSDSIKGFGKTQIDANAAARDFEAAIDDATSALTDNGATLDITTEKGRANQAALDDIATAALANAAAIAQTTGSQDEAAAAVQRGRDELIKMLAQFGITGAAADEYANKVGLIKENVSTAVQLTGVEAATNAIDQLVRPRVLQITANATNAKVGFGLGDGHAGGGDLDYAPGPKGVDSMYFKGAKGEHVLTADDVDAMGGQSAVYAFRRRLHAAASARAASIGIAQTSYSPTVMPVPFQVPSGPELRRDADVNIQITNKSGVSLSDLIDARIETADGWKTLELNSGVGR